MTSPLPPRRRDSRNLADLIRQDRQNLKQLAPGFVGGRFPPAKPLGRPFSDDEEDDGGDETILFLNTDTKTATADGASLTIALTHTPIDGSSQVYQNGVGLRATEWHREGAYLTIPGQRWFRAGDVFWVDYAYVDDDDPGSTNLDGLVLRGVTKHVGTLPVETQVGDFVVIATRDNSLAISDSRFPLLSTPGTESRVYAGIATSLDPFYPTGTGTSLVAIASFVGGALVNTVNFNTIPSGSPYASVAAQPGIAAFGVASERSSFVGGSVGLSVSPWLFAVDDVESPGWGQVAIWYWFDATATTTPALAPHFSGGINETDAVLVTLNGTGE